MALSDSVAGMDEVGRGALAGPVVTCACILREPLQKYRDSSGWHPKSIRSLRITDSKMLGPVQRESAAAWLRHHAFFAFGLQSQQDIDRFGIVAATERAMQMAIDGLVQQAPVSSVLVDGRDKFHFSIPHTSVVKGDALEPSIASASILAKVMRDALMRRAGAVFPQFGFEGHKGYGSEVHRRAIVECGPCALHRLSFLGLLREQLTLC